MKNMVACILAAVHICATAQDDVGTYLRNIQPSIKSAVVTVLPAGVLYLVPVTESDLPRFGCIVKIEALPELFMLFTILGRAEIKAVVGEDEPNHPHLSIVLTPRDGKPIHIIFAGVRNSDGFVHGTIDGKPVYAAPTFPSDLSIWTMKQNPQRWTANMENCQAPVKS